MIRPVISVLSGSTPAIEPDQDLFSSAEVTPTTQGLVTDATGSGNTGKLKNAPCLTSTGSLVLNFTNLTGVTITSWEGTSTLTKSSNTITTTSGTLYNIVLSNGKIIPCSEGEGILLFSSDGLWRVTITGETVSATIWAAKQDSYFFSYANNVSKIPYWGPRADLSRLSYQTSIGFNSGTDAMRAQGIEELKLQNFVYQSTIITTSSIAQRKNVFVCNYSISTQNAGWSVGLGGAGTTLIFKKATDTSTLVTTISTAFTAINDGLPHKIAIAKNGTALSFYVDGVLINTATLASDVINYSTGISSGIETAIGAEFLSFYNDAFDSGHIYNLQVGAYSAGHVTNITSQADFDTPVSRWKLIKKVRKKGTLVYDDDILGNYLTPVTSGTIYYPFVPFSAGGYGYAKGHWWADQGYTLDLTNGGTNAALSGKETNLSVSDVRVNADGNFKFYDNLEGTNVITYTETIDSDKIEEVRVQIGYVPADAVLYVGEHGQSNMQAYNVGQTDPAAQYLSAQNSKIYAPLSLNTTFNDVNPIWRVLEAKVNNEGQYDTESVAMNVAISKDSEAYIGTDKLRFVKYAMGGTTVCQSGTTDWNPASVGKLLDKSEEYITAAVAATTGEGIPIESQYLAQLSWYQGEGDMQSCSNIDSYYKTDVITIIKRLLQAYIDAGVNTSKCIVVIYVVNFSGASSDPDRVKVRLNSMNVGLNGKYIDTSLQSMCKDIVFVGTDGYGTWDSTVHVTKVGQVNAGIDTVANILQYSLREFYDY